MKKQTKLIGLCLLAVSAAWGQENTPEEQAKKIVDLDEVVVSDSRFELKRENSGKTVISITGEELERQQGNSLATIINRYSGIEINGSRSNAGQNLNYYVRGGNNRQVLIMIDGIQMNDPSQIAGDYDLRLIDASQVASVEIIKGAASTLYGNSAATAVIRIATKESAKKNIAATLRSSVGTNQGSEDLGYDLRDFQNSVQLDGTLGKATYAVGLGHVYTDGLSAVEGEERDPFNRLNTRVQLGYRFSEALNLRMGATYDDFRADYDNGFPLEDAPFYSENVQKRLFLSTEYKYNSGSVHLNASYYNITRDLQSNFPSAYEADNMVFDLYNKYILNEKFYTIVGFNHIRSEADLGSGSSESFTISDPYVNVVYISGSGLQFNTGARWNNHSTYGSNLTYNFNPSYTLRFDNDYLKFMGSYSSSFIAPTLTQLYGPFGANPDLEPEENITVEGGVEYKTRALRMSALYFNRQEENFIGYRTIDFETFEGEYYNVEEAFRVEGVEFEFKANMLTSLSLNGNYTFTQVRDQVRLRIPKHKANAAVNYAISKATTADVSVQYTGEREDINFATFGNEVLEAFTVVNAGVSHRFSPSFSGSLRVNNLFNESYREIIGYPTRGRNVMASVKVSL
ncbi:TonB-dependent receptor plug domain-containing protein [Robertkochia sediminum]|uniref:TonB-dependent receptor plug domain-containing protein n=1 Tax=Robertkochia sediminum TaxID=2785326 RepID=UPI0019349440|nr:TonB-dependent receptor [Robertkochia sediminum]MBL7473143.1 TonB-dependent receptor [Robertkochia sediminum]